MVGESKRRARWSVGLAVLVGLMGATSGVALASSAAPRVTPAAVPGCTSSGLVVWLDTEGNGAAGSFYYSLEFTNLSGHACTMTGAPGVSGVTLAGKQLGAAASRNETGPAKMVTLAPGQNVVSTLRITDTGVYSAAQCGQTTAAGLRVYPPGSTRSKIVPFPFSACSKSGVSYLSVTAVSRAGAGSTA